jgi:DNA repair protein RadC
MHEGHRQRLLGRLREGDNLYEHELLEILLFNAYPRKDVSPVAHALLERFASLKEVLDADVKELCTVDGIGENVALYLKCVGRCVQTSNNCDCFALLKNTQQLIEFMSPRFRGKKAEELEIYLLDRAGRVKRIAHYTTNDEISVTVKRSEILTLLTISKPYGIFVAHNHVNCATTPSKDDDALTKELQIMCSLNDIVFLDHCIYSDTDTAYSYFFNDRIIKIRKDYSIDNLIRTKFID